MVIAERAALQGEMGNWAGEKSAEVIRKETAIQRESPGEREAPMQGECQTISTPPPTASLTCPTPPHTHTCTHSPPPHTCTHHPHIHTYLKFFLAAMVATPCSTAGVRAMCSNLMCSRADGTISSAILIGSTWLSGRAVSAGKGKEAHVGQGCCVAGT